MRGESPESLDSWNHCPDPGVAAWMERSRGRWTARRGPWGAAAKGRGGEGPRAWLCARLGWISLVEYKTGIQQSIIVCVPVRPWPSLPLRCSRRCLLSRRGVRFLLRSREASLTILPVKVAIFGRGPILHLSSHSYYYMYIDLVVPNATST